MRTKDDQVDGHGKNYDIGDGDGRLARLPLPYNRSTVPSHRPAGRARALTLGAALSSALLTVVCAQGAARSAPSDSTAIPASRLIDSARLFDDLRALSADGMAGRRVGTPGGAQARAYVIARFEAAGLEPIGDRYDHPFRVRVQEARATELTGANVLGVVRGTDRPDRYLIVSAHYDHVGVIEGRVFNGADDNASGTAALFALATYFTQHRPAHSLLFAAFDGEEEGLLGSRAFVRQPPVPRDALGATVNVDMIGRDDTNTLWVTGTFQQPFLKPLIARVAAEAPVHLRMGHDNPRDGRENWIGDSDQYSFFQAGIPALYVGVADEAQHHQPTDDYETITREFYVRAVETVLAIVQAFDREDMNRWPVLNGALPR
jgi:hypothetical protein